MTKISVIIPTFRRPEGLRRALSSVLAQADGPDAPDFEIIVVDNAPEGGAQAGAADLAASAPVTLRFVHEPRAGVANARNAGWRAAAGERLAWLDDDMEALPGWLAALDRALDQVGGAAAAFGPIAAALPADAPGDHRDFLAGFFARTGPAETGPAPDYFGCGNCMIDRARAGLGDAPFDPAANEMGGEDDRLFSAMQRAGARFAWAAEARTLEHAPPQRANLRYALLRSFAHGQGPSQTAAEHRRYGALAFWMGVGAGQALVYGAAAGALWLAGSKRRARFTGRAAQGLGKVFWQDPFAPRLYGQPSSADSGTSSSAAAPMVASAARAEASGSTDSP